MSSKPIELNGEYQTLAEWCRRYGVRYMRTVMRLDRGWSLQDALTLPHNPPRRRARPSSRDLMFTINGRTQNLRQWCAEYGVPYLKIWKRLDRGWEIEAALSAPGGVFDKKKLEAKRSVGVMGMRFGRLQVVAAEGVSNRQKGLWRCICDCGNEKITDTHALRSGHTSSCGCLQTEVRSTNHRTHGLRHRRIYTTWLNMKARCENPKSTSYRNYGARGISVCDRWQSFQSFYSDMGDVPADLTLERLNNSEGYSPENCAWKSRAIQGRNRRTNVVLTIDGRTMVLKDWCAEYGVAMSMVWRRRRRGWTIEEAITRPRLRKRPT